ncbi:MAG: hypothetical protein PSV17_05875 [Methylotenera sp.]|uniref:hypothetical protein n=1 Tax=Methylotenera sp. TaxID=2051956 RepID=UPI002486CFB7|nr:hypothetical protein [Methylotenera sp.]MDI1308946.1 hypothetical protein [Methylotenera sp.]
MKNLTLKLVVLSALSVASAQTYAAGTLCSLVAAPTGSAYINAYNSGRTIPPLAGPATTDLLARMTFGSTPYAAGSGGSCEITGLANSSTAPVAGYTLAASTNRPLPYITGGGTSIGTVVDRVWRNSAKTMCIFGTQVSNLTNTNHTTGGAGGTTGPYFEVNGIARGGHSGSGAVNVGYFLPSGSNASPAFRVGRTFTSVQHRNYIYGGGTLAEQQNNGSGYLDLPTIAGSTTLNINGVNTALAANTVTPAAGAGQQDAQVNSNWVEFTVDSVYKDDDGGTNAVSAMTYIEAPCNSSAPSTWVKTGAIRLRQTAQELASFKEIAIDGYAPPGATVP